MNMVDFVGQLEIRIISIIYHDSGEKEKIIFVEEWLRQTAGVRYNTSTEYS